MTVEEMMAELNVTDEDLDRMAEPYESGTWEGGVGTVYSGSHLDAVGKRRQTVVYDASVVQRVSNLARRQGVKPSEVYRNAMDFYLAAQNA